MKRFISLILSIALLFSAMTTLSGCGKTKQMGTGASEYATTRDVTGRDIKFVEMCIKGYGRLVILLDATTAPETVANFLSLVESKFYDGLTFHRVIKDFMVQGGDPKGDGTGNGPNTIKGEFSQNGHQNDISHKYGVISMARSKDYNSASCQFFICNADARRSLDYQYAAFGYVLSGMSVVDAITGTCYPLANPYYNYTLTDKTLQPVIEQIVQITRDEALALCD